MNKLLLDIENTPNTVHRWDMYDSSPVRPNQLLEPMRLLCFAAKWKGSKSVKFFSPHTFPDAPNPHKAMVLKAHELLTEADVLVTYNGKSHDGPHLDTEFARYKLKPPAPYHHLDLYRTVKRKFKFPFKSLDYVCGELGLGHKAKSAGHGDLWLRCMLEDDAKAWSQMARYNKQDVLLLDLLDDYLMGWEVGTANARLLVAGDVCPKCGVGELRREGYRLLSTGKYQRFQCRDCGGWSQSTRREEGTTVRSIET